MENEKQNQEITEEEPQVYTVKKDLSGWRFDRRTFLTAAGATVAAAAVASCGSPTPQEPIVVVDVVATPTFTPASDAGAPPDAQVEATRPPAPTKAPQAGQPSQPSQPSEPSATPRPSNTPGPTSTTAPTRTPTPETPQAEFVKDVTIPDGTEMTPNQPFTKTWRYRNSGDVEWGAGVKLVFVNETIKGYKSNKMSGPDFVNVPNVAPGDTVDISVKLVAPATEGRYRSYWRLRLPNGEWLENNHYVEIVVKKPATATWTPTTCACDGVCECEGYCGDHQAPPSPKPTRPKHYWHPN